MSKAKTQALHGANVDPLDISVNPEIFTVADLHQLLSMYPQDVPVRLGFFESTNSRAKPDFYPITRMTFGTIPNSVSDEKNPPDEAAFVLMFDTGITGEEFEGPHDAFRDHAAGIVNSAASASTSAPQRGKGLRIVK